MKALTIVALVSFTCTDGVRRSSADFNLLQLFIPVSTTAAIFSIPSDTFPFERSIRVFCIMTAVLITVLLVILSLTFKLYLYRRVFSWASHLCRQLYRLARRGLRFTYPSPRLPVWTLFGFASIRSHDLEHGRIRLGSDDGFELMIGATSREQVETESQPVSSLNLLE